MSQNRVVPERYPGAVTPWPFAIGEFANNIFFAVSRQRKILKRDNDDTRLRCYLSVLCAPRLRVLCECGLRPFGRGSSDCSSDRSSSGGGSIGTSAYLEPGRGRRREGRETGRRTGITTAAGRNSLPASSAKPMAPAPCRLLVSVGDEDEGGDTARWLYHNAVECQRVRLAFSWMGWIGLGWIGADREKKQGFLNAKCHKREPYPQSQVLDGCLLALPWFPFSQ